LALALENPDVAIQVVGQHVNKFVDNVGGEISGFVGGLFSAVTFGVVDAVLDTGEMEDERRERLFEDVDVLSSRAFRRSRYSWSYFSFRRFIIFLFFFFFFFLNKKTIIFFFFFF
jgi:hypothetical protein